MRNPRAIVVGAGVSGLTTAVCLAEAGWSVRVLARDTPMATSSASAGAMWGPYLVSDPRVEPWSLESLHVLEELAADPSTGVAMVTGVEASRSPITPPGWTAKVRDFARCAPGDLPDGFVSGWRSTIPVIDMTAYLGFLCRRLERAEVDIEEYAVRSFDDPALDAPVIVNCSAIGARDLVPDERLVPIQGQLVVVDNPGIHEFFADHDDDPTLMAYILPQGDRVVLGGSADRGRSDLRVDPDVGAGILARCIAIDPRLAGARVLGHRVGLRPNRDRIRLDAAPLGSRRLIHNYGHGGSGVSLSWGCAREVLALADADTLP
ncbi:FAD-dependent oxidoreductase [Longispora sp. NPDC051575]|uniref:FAD-dependent oxidoreductase n=1 Tax=Longispora sp. NPDC051575 TaxID=3154943 RepID=UPI00343B25B2